MNTYKTEVLVPGISEQTEKAVVRKMAKLAIAQRKSGSSIHLVFRAEKFMMNGKLRYGIYACHEAHIDVDKVRYILLELLVSAL